MKLDNFGSGLPYVNNIFPYYLHITYVIVFLLDVQHVVVIDFKQTVK